MKKILISPLLIIFGLSLLGAKCKKEGPLVVNWPEMCQAEKELPADFPQEMVYPGARAIIDPEGHEGEHTSVFFCTPDEAEKVLGWYKEQLDEYEYDGLEITKMHAWSKGKNQATLVWGMFKVVEGFSVFVINATGF